MAPEFDASKFTTAPFNASSEYYKDYAKFQAELKEKQKKDNDNLLSGMISGMNPDCNNFFDVKSLKNSLDSLFFHAYCNPNCSSSVKDKIAQLKAKLPEVEQELAAYKQNQKEDEGKSFDFSLDTFNKLNRTI